MILRPGPEALEPGLAPDGVVVRVYSVPGEELLLEQRIEPGMDIKAMAEAGGAAVADCASEVCLVAYDGDSGQRLKFRP